MVRVLPPTGLGTGLGGAGYGEVKRRAGAGGCNGTESGGAGRSAQPERFAPLHGTRNVPSGRGVPDHRFSSRKARVDQDLAGIARDLSFNFRSHGLSLRGLADPGDGEAKEGDAADAGGDDFHSVSPVGC